MPVGAVGPRQVRVRVHATAINPLDYQIRRGDYPDLVPLPAIIGHDVSGVVEETGASVSEFDIGDEVYYTPKIFAARVPTPSTMSRTSTWSLASRATSAISRPPV